MADDLAQRADQMLALWSTLAMNHVALGSACACGMGGISLRLNDFELDIVDYLEDAGRRCEVPAVAAYFIARHRPDERPRPLVELLEDIEREQMPRHVAEWLMPRVEKTLRSYAELHGPQNRS